MVFIQWKCAGKSGVISIESQKIYKAILDRSIQFPLSSTKTDQQLDAYTLNFHPKYFSQFAIFIGHTVLGSSPKIFIAANERVDLEYN